MQWKLQESATEDQLIGRGNWRRYDAGVSWKLSSLFKSTNIYHSKSLRYQTQWKLLIRWGSTSSCLHTAPSSSSIEAGRSRLVIMSTVYSGSLFLQPTCYLWEMRRICLIAFMFFLVHLLNQGRLYQQFELCNGTLQELADSQDDIPQVNLHNWSLQKL